MALTLALAAPGVARAQPLSGNVGYDYYAASQGQITRSIGGTAVAKLGAASASLSGSRFDDTLVGQGTGVGAGLVLPVTPSTRLRISGTRLIGDADFRGWRLKAGPQFRLSTGQAIGLYALHYDDTVQGASNAVSFELRAPVSEALSWRVSAGYASSAGPGGAEGSAGLSWAPTRHLELSGDVGVVQGGIGASGSFPSRRPRNTNNEVQPYQGNAEVGVRLVLP